MQKYQQYQVKLTRQNFKQVVQIYKHLHKIPEIGLKQFQTTSFIKDFVSKIKEAIIIKPQLQNGLQTGLIVMIEANQANKNDKNRDQFWQQKRKDGYLFRADIDALAFKQESGVSYMSQNGLHHACGHDAHTAILLVALKNIAQNKSKLKRNIYFCFQPGQQGHGGASKILAKHPSLLQNISNCFGLHVTNYKLSSILLIPQQYVTANSNRFTIQVIGKSAHCMLPHAAIDANYIGCQIVNQIYSCKNRLIQPTTGMSIAITKIQGGSDNVTSISNKMKIWGSIRSYQKKFHQKVIEHIEKFTKYICELNGAQGKFQINPSNYRAVKNEKSAIQIVHKAAKQIFKQNIQFTKPSFAGQDFCQFSQRRPSCYFNLTVGLPDSIDNQTNESKFPIHSSKFKLQEKSLWKGCALWVEIAFS